MGVGLHGWAFAGSFPVACGWFVQLHACHIGMYGTSQGQSTLTDTLNVGIVSLDVSKYFTDGDRVAAAKPYFCYCLSALWLA